MRTYLTISLLLSLSVVCIAQSTGQRTKSTVYSTSSDWQKIVLKSTLRATTQARRANTSTQSASAEKVDFRPAFTGDFATNRNGWKAGNRGDYYYQIGLGRYSIRKRNANTREAAFSTVELPTTINLNLADVFTIKVDMLADSGQVPSGGILFGVLDSLNYCAFTLNGKGEVSIVRVANGQTFGDYMPGDYFLPGVLVEKNRDRLMIERRGQGLHFYINAQEIRSSPYLFKMLPGNGIGVTSSGYWTSFQKLGVTIGPASGTYTPITAPETNRAVESVSDRSEPTVTNTLKPIEVDSSAKRTMSPSTAPSAPIGSPAKSTKSTRPAVSSFSDSFERNNHGWFTGTRKGYEFELNKGSYYIRRLPDAKQEAGRCYVDLPANMNLTKAESFTISVEMTAAPGEVPTGGILFGVQDVENMMQFSIAGQNSVIIKSLRDGRTFASYMPGQQSASGVPIDKETNLLTVSKQQNKLYFYINGQEITGSPYEFRPFRGNSIGFITGPSTMKFRNLSVMAQQ
ncbi:hypothetical protein [Spirosoma spitsbergense]|uniref:hypothetical protein n=1 Tax=Spirosoma spitsbergense TaxID=431554 RepID=UPI00036BF712|nr:hypothetical protein [Spirosoma spitsbergense]